MLFYSRVPLHVGCAIGVDRRVFPARRVNIPAGEQNIQERDENCNCGHDVSRVTT